MKTKLSKPYWEMTAAELDEATKEFDKPFVPSKPLTPDMRAAWNRAKRRKPGRPRIGKGAKRVLVTIEQDMLKRIDAAAKKAGLSRSAFLVAGARTIMKPTG